MALQPLYDTAGAGLSLLDTILHTRVSAEGVVARTTTRLLYACKYAQSASPQELCEVQAHILSDADPEATGLLVVLPTTMWGVLESSPEAVALLLRWMQSDISAKDPKVLGCRILAQIEDCPVRAFGPWSYRSMSQPAEPGAIDLDSESPVTAGVRLYQAALAVGAAVLESGSSVLDHLTERFGPTLPSDERVSALTHWDKLTSCQEWLDLFDRPPVLITTSESIYPVLQ